VDTVLASNRAMLFRHRDGLTRTMGVITGSFRIDFTGQLKVDHERVTTIEHQIASMEVPMTYAEAVNRADQSDNPQAHLRELAGAAAGHQVSKGRHRFKQRSWSSILTIAGANPASASRGSST